MQHNMLTLLWRKTFCSCRQLILSMSGGGSREVREQRTPSSTLLTLTTERMINKYSPYCDIFGDDFLRAK